MDQSTLSRHIAALEKETGLNLLLHDGSSNLTTCASQLLPEIEALDNAAAHLEKRVAELVEEKNSAVRLAYWSFETPSRNLVIEAALRLQKRGVPLNVVTVASGNKDPFDLLVDGKADMALTVGGEHLANKTGYRWFKLTKRRLYALSYADLPAGEDGTVSLSALDGYRLPFPVGSERAAVGSAIIRCAHKNGAELHPVYLDGDGIIASSYSEDSDLIWLMPHDRISDVALVPPSVRERMRQYAVVEDCDEIDIYVVWRANESKAAVSELVDELQSL